MELVKTTLKTEEPGEMIGPKKNSLLGRFELVSELVPPPTFDCEICSDTGLESVRVEYRGRIVSESRECRCRARRIARAKLDRIPPEYRGVSLEGLRPRTDIHPAQAKWIELLKKHPSGKFVIAGDFGTGKTHFFWALYAHAVNSGRRVWAGTARALIADYQKAIEASQNSERYFPGVTADELRQKQQPYSVFLDDLDKARATEYAAEQLFEIVEACYSFGHQTVVTTNLRIDELTEHFAGADRRRGEDGFGRYGGSIMRRLLDQAHEIEMF